MRINYRKKHLSAIASFFKPLRGFLAAHNPLKTEGSALVTAIILSVIVAMLAIIGANLISTSFNNIMHQEHQGAEADNVARAGLVDAISWFKNQTTQPVAVVATVGGSIPNGEWADEAFNPQFSTTAALCTTIDTSIGLVQEYPLNYTNVSGLWGRYEVCRQTNPAIAVVDPYAVHDITGQRYFNGTVTGNGYAWFIGSRGYVFTPSSGTTTCCGGTSVFSAKNVLARSLVSTEIRRITLNLPSNVKCAVYTNNESVSGNPTVVINKLGRIQEGLYGIGYSATGGANPPYTLSGGTITTGTSGVGTYTTGLSSPTPSYVLGVSTSDLQIMANYLVTNVNQLPQNVGSMTLVYICGSATFTSSNPLFSSGILFVDGDLTFAAGAYCAYQGLIYCTGNVYVYDSNVIEGCVVAWKSLTLSQAGCTESCSIVYSDSVLGTVRATVCKYREMKSTYRVFTGISGF